MWECNEAWRHNLQCKTNGEFYDTRVLGEGDNQSSSQVDDAHARLGKYDSPHACILSILRHDNYDASLHSHIAMMNFWEALGLGSFECP